MGITLPFGGVWANKTGYKRAFLTGTVISAGGLILSAISPNVLYLIIFRAIVGIGYGIVFMTCQGFIIDVTSEQDRAKGMAVFISAFYSGTLCGSAIGGMIAERIGFRTVFYLGAFIGTISILSMYIFIKETPSIRKKQGETRYVSISQLANLLKNRAFTSLTLFQGIPSKICLIGLVYYTAPLFLKEIGSSQSSIGRIVMGYSVIMVFMSPITSKWIDKVENIKFFIALGSFFSGLSLLPVSIFKNSTAITISIILIGIFHSFTVAGQAKLATQLKIVQEVGVGGGLGVYRLLERLGNVIAPITVGYLASIVGFPKSLAITGIFIASSSILFFFMFKE